MAVTAHHQHVIDYFDQTRNDYRLLWGVDRHFGLHCGYFETGRRHDDAVLHMNRVLALLAGIRGGERVLDAGCGIGGSALWLAENLGAHVVGVNVCPRQIEQAHRLARERGLGDQVQFHVADFCDTGLPGESFDVVWALESACYAEDKPGLLAEAHRLLRPGGRLIVADAFLTRSELTDHERGLVQRWQSGWAIPDTAGVDQFRQWLAQARFRGVAFRDVTEHVVPSSRRIYLAALIFYPIGLLLYWAGLRTAIQTRGIASGYYQYLARRRGLGVYGIFVAEK
jgi:cyclopropane fatty-acyl-phospholipid synthase-like methyltransferase